MDDNKEIKYDVDGEDILSETILKLVNNYPLLDSDDAISFSVLSEDKGKAFYPTSGAVVQSEKESITGHVTQNCMYPFNIIYRATPTNEERKIYIKEWLDNLGKWLERQCITVNGEQIRLKEYPKLFGSRKITTIERQSPAFVGAVNQNKTEDWYISIIVRYRNEYDR